MRYAQVLSAFAAMPNDLPQWAERNRKIDALRCAPTAKPPAFPGSPDYSGINVPLVAVCNVPPVARCNVPPQKWLQ